MAFALVFWMALAVAAITALVVGWRARHGMLFTGLALLVIAAIWTLAKVANDRNYHDADGWADCWPSCTALQRGVGVSLVGGALLAGVLEVAFAIAAVRGRKRH